MAIIERRKGTYRVKVRRQGAPPLTATFARLAEAKKWAQMTESAVLEGRHFTATEAKRHTLGDLIDHHFSEVLLQKRPSTIPTQTQHLHWWKVSLVIFFLPMSPQPLWLHIVTCSPMDVQMQQ